MIIYKNILLKLKNAGYSTTRLRKEKILSEATIQAIRENKHINTKSIESICLILDCQPNHIMQIVNDSERGVVL